MKVRLSVTAKGPMSFTVAIWSWEAELPAVPRVGELVQFNQTGWAEEVQRVWHELEPVDGAPHVTLELQFLITPPAWHAYDDAYGLRAIAAWLDATAGTDQTERIELWARTA